MGINQLLSFREYTDKLFTTKIVIAVTLLLMILLYWVWVQFAEHAALVYMVMGLMILVFALFEWKQQKSELIQVILFGDRNRMLLSIIMGTLLGWLLVTQGQIIIGTPIKLATSGTLDFLYVVIAASWMESLFFFGILSPTLMMWLKNDLIGVIAGSSVFAGFHFMAYGGMMPFMIAAFIFSVIATILAFVLKSQGVSVAMHFTNNWLVWAG